MLTIISQITIDLSTRKRWPAQGSPVVSAKSWWRTPSHVLDVHAQDLNSGQIRNHHGWIAIDPSRPQRATRTIFYDDSDEIEEQRILISDDGNTLHVFDESVGGGYSKKHALRRRMSPASFILEFRGRRISWCRRGAARNQARGGHSACSSRLCPCILRCFLFLAFGRDRTAVSAQLFGCPRFGFDTDCRYHHYSRTISTC